VFVVLIACPLAKPCEAGGSSWGFNRTNSRSYLAQKGSVIKLDINLKVFSYKKGNYPGCQVQGSLFRGSTRTEPLYMRRALNWLRKNPGLTVQS